LPAEHATQLVAPEVEEYVPVTHGEQVLAPICEYDPAAQPAQLDADTEYLPATQALQLAEPVVSAM